MAGKHILFCVLNWGLGHATRSIPVIRACINEGYRVSLASDGMPLTFLRDEFPALTTFELPGYNISYEAGSFGLRAWKMLRNVRRAIQAEHHAVSTLHAQHHFDACITDNRYGCYINGIPNVIITHQLKVIGTNLLGDRLATGYIRRWLRPFDGIWIPDRQDRILSGELSHGCDPRVAFIGPLSTVGDSESLPRTGIACILSGPEPARTDFEDLALKQLLASGMDAVLVRGVNEPGKRTGEGKLTIFNQMDRRMISKLLAVSEIVICRSGYSSLMDLFAIGRKAILVPTPGQPEQEYLADRLKDSPHFVVQEQRELDLESGMRKLISQPDPPQITTDRTRIRSLINRISTYHR